MIYLANDFIGVKRDGIYVGSIAPKEVKHYTWGQVDRVYVHFFLIY
jgi:hypothetical protein